MVVALLSIAFGAVLIASAVSKLVDGPGSRAALASYGVVGALPQKVTWIELIAVEFGLGVLVICSVDLFTLTAAALLLVFATAQAVALARGKRGRPCACFGSRGSISPRGVAISYALAVAYGVLPWLPERALSTDEYLGMGLGVALLAYAALLVALLALAREVGVLRAQLAPAGALDVPYEGPEIGARSQLVHAFGTILPEQLGLAVFTSDGCRLCRALHGAIESLGRHPLVALKQFDEVRDAEAWEVADAPGSPYAVCLDADGTVLAKGTFNSHAQLESVLAAAERRRRELRV